MMVTPQPRSKHVSNSERIDRGGSKTRHPHLLPPYQHNINFHQKRPWPSSVAQDLSTKKNWFGRKTTKGAKMRGGGPSRKWRGGNQQQRTESFKVKSLFLIQIRHDLYHSDAEFINKNEFHIETTAISTVQKLRTRKKWATTQPRKTQPIMIGWNTHYFIEHVPPFNCSSAILIGHTIQNVPNINRQKNRVTAANKKNEKIMKTLKPAVQSWSDQHVFERRHSTSLLLSSSMVNAERRKLRRWTVFFLPSSTHKIKRRTQPRGCAVKTQLYYYRLKIHNFFWKHYLHHLNNNEIIHPTPDPEHFARPQRHKKWRASGARAENGKQRRSIALNSRDY
jgi:hypothetical protein